MDIEYRLRELLMPILGIPSIEQIQPGMAFVNDLAADSIDFVEILYVIEAEFGVKIKIQEITMLDYGTDTISRDGMIDAQLAARLNADFNTDRFHEGETVKDIYKRFTVRDLATIVKRKKVCDII